MDIDPKVKVNIKLSGFGHIPKFDEEVKKTLDQFMSKKSRGNIDIRIEYDVKHLPQEFYKNYEEVFTADDKLKFQDENGYKFIHVPEVSPLTDLISKTYSDIYLNKEDPEYTLFIVNHYEFGQYYIMYGSSKDIDKCLIPNILGAFCHLSVDDEASKSSVLRTVSLFLDSIFAPSLPEDDSIGKINRFFIPIISFGPKVASSAIKPSFDSALPAGMECHVTVAYKSIVDFPLIASAYYSGSNIGESISSSSNIFGKIGAISNESTAVFPVFVFNSLDNRGTTVTSEKSSAIFVTKDEDVESRILTALWKFLPTDAAAISGHHPVSPHGGSKTFSPMIRDAVARALAYERLSEVRRAIDHSEEISERIESQNLYWANVSKWINREEALKNKTLDAINKLYANKLPDALALSSQAAQLAVELERKFTKLERKASVFGRCCPIIKFVRPKRPAWLSFIVIASFIVVCCWALMKARAICNRRRKGYIPAVLDF